MFTWSEQDLNPEQNEAVQFPGSLFLAACPGSGKTKTLTYKIAFELSTIKSLREFVVALTYTHRAADEIQERIESLGVDTSQLWIGTIHSFCLEWIIKPYGIYEPELAFGYRVIDQHERELLLEKLCSPHSRQKVTFWDCDYFFTPTGYMLGCTDKAKHPIIQKILDEYFSILVTNRQIDFELILWHACKLIEKVPSISVLLSKLFPIILVDEYQDTKEIQYSIITFILKVGQGCTRLFMVGDANQAIYGSLGGYAIEIDELRALTGIQIEERSLTLNYRSSTRIIDYFSNFNVRHTIVQPASINRGYSSLVTYNFVVSKDNLVEEIVKVIEHNTKILGITPNEICVLAPQWVHLATMTRRLVVRMPEYQFDGPGLVPFARDVENFWYRLSRIALTEPSPNMFVRRLKWAGEFLDDLKSMGIDTSDLSSRNLLRLCNAISIDEDDGLRFLRQFFDTLFNQLRITFQNFAQLAEHHQAFFASSESRIARLLGEGIDSIGDIKYFKKVFQNRNGITISTIHGVKGSEFDTVIAYALLEGMVPHFSDQNGDISAQKLLYVTSSRARKNLHLFSETGRSRGRYGNYQSTRMLSSYVFNYDQI